MKTIKAMVYDKDAEMIANLCRRYALPPREVIKSLLDVVRDEIIYADEWFGEVADENVEV